MKKIPQIFRKTLMYPFQAFIRDSRSTGILLLIGTTLSLLLANSSWAGPYQSAIHFYIPTPFRHQLHLPHTILHWINDGLMTLFFFLAGLEIKRELVKGELSTGPKAMLPVVAALGGMIVPALLYLLFNNGTTFSSGWGIPMATDIAFSLGIASLLGKRVPLALKIFLTALAIIDDLGAILVIAIFYTRGLQWSYLVIALGICVVQYVLYWKRYFGWTNLVLSLALWYCLFNSGIHPTLAGVIAALFIPVDQLEKLEHRLHTPVNFLIIPLFALANTAIVFPTDIMGAFTHSLSIGIIAGLMLGKPLGIVTATYICVKIKPGSMPSNTSWMQITGAGILAAIGFTMSIFIATLAFSKDSVIDVAKMAVLAASLLSIIAGILWFRIFTRP